MKARRHHPRLSKLLAPYFGSRRQAQSMLSLYLLRQGWKYEDWISYRHRLADVIRTLLHRRAVQRHQRAQEGLSLPTPTLPIAPEGSGLTTALRASEGE